MSEKISWTELRKAVAKRIGTSEKEATAFLNALIPAIKEGLKQEGTVRINGLGTFSLKEMSPRKSVNVNTGEQITIPGYKKIVFTAEAAMRDTLDHVKIDPIQKLGEQAIEIMGIIGELKEMDGKPETPVESADAQVIEPEAPVKSADAPVNTNSEAKKPAISRPWLTASITILCFALVLAGAFLFAGYQFKNWVEGLHQRVGAPVESAEAHGYSADAQVIEPETPVKSADAPVNINSEAITSDSITSEAITPNLPDLSETLMTVELNQDSRLAWLSYKYYGTKDLWVIIYEANKEVLPSPHRIPVGTPIRIPKLSEEWLDMNRPETKAVVDSLKGVWERK